MNVHAATLSRVLNASRKLWAGSDEAPAVREIAYRLASAIAAEDPDFDQRAFVLGCGYEWPDDAATPEQREKALREAAAGPPFTPAWEAMQECFRAEIERREPAVGACSHARSVTTTDGSGAYCASCGETLA